MTRGDERTAALRAAWNALEPEALAEDAATCAAADWMRAAWARLEPAAGLEQATRRALPLHGARLARVSEPPSHAGAAAPARTLVLAAAAAALLFTLVVRRPAPEPSGAVASRVAPAGPRVRAGVARLQGEHLELRSGSVRLLLPRPATDALPTNTLRAKPHSTPSSRDNR